MTIELQLLVDDALDVDGILLPEFVEQLFAELSYVSDQSNSVPFEIHEYRVPEADILLLEINVLTGINDDPNDIYQKLSAADWSQQLILTNVNPSSELTILVYEPPTCSLVANPTNGYFIMEHDWADAGDAGSFACLNEYKVPDDYGENLITCLQSGAWSKEPLPACVPVAEIPVSCPELPSVDGGSITVYSSYVNGTALLDCDDVDQRIIKCQADGMWSDPSLSCDPASSATATTTIDNSQFTPPPDEDPSGATFPPDDFRPKPWEMAPMRTATEHQRGSSPLLSSSSLSSCLQLWGYGII